MSLPSLMISPIFAKFDLFDVMSLFMALLVWGIAIFIMIHYDGDWNSFIWYIINEIIVGIGFLLFIIPGIVLLVIWAKRAGIAVALLGTFLGVIGAAIGSSFGYESEGFLS